MSRISNAETSTGTGATTTIAVLNISNAGPIAISKSGDLFVHETSGQLVESLNPRLSAPTFTKVSDSFYSNNAAGIRSLAIGSDNYLYTADNGQGVTIGTP